MFTTGSDFRERNVSITGIGQVTGAVAPHGNTIRSTFTVPAGKFLLIQSMFGKMLRDVVAGAAGLANMQSYVNTPNSGPTIFLDVAYSLNGAVDSKVDLSWKGNLFFPTGNQIIVQTADLSTGGSYTIMSGINGIQNNY